MNMELLDTGTRYEHYCELLELWESALVILDGYDFYTSVVLDKKAQLKAAVTILTKQIDVLADFETKQSQLRQAIDSIPAHEEPL